MYLWLEGLITLHLADGLRDPLWLCYCIHMQIHSILNISMNIQFLSCQFRRINRILRNNPSHGKYTPRLAITLSAAPTKVRLRLEPPCFSENQIPAS
ncbi:hypothetical protein B0O99DRAFT_206619 [Bisporella sp. PMI_857]|nr:hypothetical protein B0O99DRAFT_206619 [Bisporella sp. PMI_857]